MKLYLKFCIALLLFGTALSGPLDGYLRTNQAFERAGAQRFPNFANVQGYPTYNLNQPVVQNLLPGKQECADFMHVRRFECLCSTTVHMVWVKNSMHAVLNFAMPFIRSPTPIYVTSPFAEYICAYIGVGLLYYFLP